MTDAERIALWRDARRYARSARAGEYADDFASFVVVRSYAKPVTRLDWALADFWRKLLGDSRHAWTRDNSPLRADHAPPPDFEFAPDLDSVGLRPRDAAILRRVFLDEESQRDVARSLGLTEARVSQIVSSALSRLRKRARRGSS